MAAFMVAKVIRRARLSSTSPPRQDAAPANRHRFAPTPEVPMRVQERFFIDGSWVAPSGSGTIDVIDASTEEPVGRIPSGDDADVDRAVQAAARAFEAWAATPPAERARFIERIKEGLAARADEIAATISAEVGTPISVAKTVQVGLPISVAGSYLAIVREFPFEERIGNSLIVRE